MLLAHFMISTHEGKMLSLFKQDVIFYLYALRLYYVPSLCFSFC